MRPRLGIALALFMALAALAALARLMSMRFEAGDLYPAYSSLRPDPLGTAALYEALQQGPLRLSRQYRSLDELDDRADTTLLYLGLDPHEVFFFDAQERHRIEAIAAEGGRVVITLLPTDRAIWWQRFKKEPEPTPEPKGKGDSAKKKAPAEGDWQGAWEADWKLTPRFIELPRGPGGRFEPASAYGSLSQCPQGLPAELPWHSAVAFQAGPGWTTLYAREGAAVMLERAVGPGSIVVMSDSFLLSNEGLRKNRQDALVAWLCAQRGRLVFDERHLGVSEQEGLAGLARSLGLMPAALVLAFLALLGLWRLGSPLLHPHPPQPDESGGAGAGQGSGATLSSLIRRHQGPQEIFSRAWGDFARSRAARGLDPKRRAAAADAAARAMHERQEPALRRVWDEIAAILKRR